jgi:hypothetical protein
MRLIADLVFGKGILQKNQRFQRSFAPTAWKKLPEQRLGILPQPVEFGKVIFLARWESPC